MTLTEKIGQLHLPANAPDLDRAAIGRGEAGGVLAFNNGRDIAEMQKLARSSRLGVPLLVGLDVLHGLRTMFPLPLGQAASFDPGLARRAAAIAGREAAAIGVNWTFAPMVDLARDPRWGRMIEGAGEDPFLGRVFARAQVEGYRDGGVIATLKHFAGYGAPKGGRDYDEAVIGAADFADSYLPPFAAGIEAGAGSVMSAFHALDGVPTSASRPLLTDALRGRLGFTGFVVSDWYAVSQLMEHGVAGGPAEAARLGLKAGIDMDMADGLYARHLPAEIAAGRVSEREVTEAARRVLRTKVAAGLFEAPAIAETASGEAAPPSPEARAAARETARDTMVLLRNEGALPLRPGSRVALIGGLADSGEDLVGPHAALAKAEDAVSLLDGLRRRVAASEGASLAYAPGCDPGCGEDAGFSAAEETARNADVVVAVLGEPPKTTGEARSRATLTLPGRQAELLRRLVDTGTPVVLVLLASRPIELGPVVDRLAGLLMAWYPGTEGGSALADLLFGDHSPSAKLPVSWPRRVGQVPLTYDRRPTGRPHEPGNAYTLRYEDEEVTPLFPFGFGLGYGRVRLRVRLANEGERAAAEVVQLYLRQPVASVSQPLRQLKAFAKVALAPGEARMLELAVPARELAFTHPDGTLRAEPGTFQVFVGTDSGAPLAGTFELAE